MRRAALRQTCLVAPFAELATETARLVRLAALGGRNVRCWLGVPSRIVCSSGRIGMTIGLLVFCWRNTTVPLRMCCTPISMTSPRRWAV